MCLKRAYTASGEVPYTENRKREIVIVGRIFCVKMKHPYVSGSGHEVARVRSLRFRLYRVLTRCELAYESLHKLVESLALQLYLYISTTYTCGMCVRVNNGENNTNIYPTHIQISSGYVWL